MQCVFRTFIRLSQELKNTILDLLNESSRFNVNDVLVHIHKDHRKLFFTDSIRPFSVAEFPAAILRDAKETQKESGVNSLCLATGIVDLTINDRLVQTALLLTPLSYTLDKVAKEYTFTADEETVFINPFLIGHLRRDLDVAFPESILAAPHLDEICTFLSAKGLTAHSEVQTIGNFHHHRYQIVKELEELESLDTFQPALSALFGMGATSLPKLKFPRTNLFPADVDHEEVFSKASSDHLVIQGPPGTGKSQVLTNLIGKFLGTSKTIIGISEKHAALEVIQKKLGTFELDRLCFIASSDRLSHSFLIELKSTWDYFERFIPKEIDNLRLSEQYEDNLQMTLDMLAQKELIGGISFDEFRTLSGPLDPAVPYSSSVPTIPHFLEHELTLKALYDKKRTAVLAPLRKRSLMSDQFLAFDQQIERWIAALASLQMHFELKTWQDLSKVMKEAALCQVYENELYKKYHAVFQPNSSAQKKFLRLRKQYNQFRIEDGEGHSEWKQLPSKEETLSLLEQLSKSSYIAKRKARKRWSTLSHLPVSKAEQSLEKRMVELERNKGLSQLLTKFYDLGIESPEIEVPLIHQTLGMFTDIQWDTFEKIPKERRHFITENHGSILDLHRELLHHFQFDDSLNLLDYFSLFKATLPEIISQRSILVQLEDGIFKGFGMAASFSQFRALIFGSHFVKFKERFPAFSAFDPSEISGKVTDIIRAKTAEAKLESFILLQGVHTKFVAYHALLNTPARKLTEDERAQKTRLRRGKSILVKEFSKTRNHPSLRELYNSEAREWIQLLKPIWLSNPTQLAKCFPLEMNLFDVAIFDEASQLPIQNALGGIQRSKQVIVAGDEQQMGPSSYFTSVGSEPMDLLHQASYYFSKVPLQHHYRSEHPDLIAFSNAHFYDGKLKAYPSANLANESVLRYHIVENGTFIDRKNEHEAQAITTCIQSHLNTTKSLGIVAFSEEQLNCIWHNLGAKLQSKMLAHLDAHGGFFKALENVQGDECELLVIGFGYAPDENGDFHMRFGPMNTANGRKRLNVLLTRAIQSIDFFCSVQSSAFKLSDNESINLIRQWISFIENYSPTIKPQFPFNLSPEIVGKVLTFSRIQNALPSAREIVTLQRTLEQRGWIVNYA